MGKPRRRMKIINIREEINKIQKTKENINKTKGSSLRKALIFKESTIIFIIVPVLSS